MPSTKKRINLTVPDNIYEQLQKYKFENGLESDATACLHLVVKALQSNENSKALFDMFRTTSLEQLKEYSNEGLSFLKEEFEKNPK